MTTRTSTRVADSAGRNVPTAEDDAGADEGVLARHCQIVWRNLARGAVIPFVGAGANRCERPSDAEWTDGFLPDARELASYLAGPYGYPESELELLRVSQWVDLMSSQHTLVDELHDVFTRECKPNKLHRFLAALPRLAREHHHRVCGQLVLTTNYDDLLEQAYVDAREPCDVVVYTTWQNEHRFDHVRPDGERVPIADPSTYRDFELEKRSVILKIHGDVDPNERESDTFVITEDDYIDYVAGQSVRALIPAYLMRRIRESDLLFLGYSMRDWNLRVVLRQIWAEQAKRTGGWSIQLKPSEIDRKFWARYGIDIFDIPLEHWVDSMMEHVA